MPNPLDVPELFGKKIPVYQGREANVTSGLPMPVQHVQPAAGLVSGRVNPIYLDFKGLLGGFDGTRKDGLTKTLKGKGDDIDPNSLGFDGGDDALKRNIYGNPYDDFNNKIAGYKKSLVLAKNMREGEDAYWKALTFMPEEDDKSTSLARKYLADFFEPPEKIKKKNPFDLPKELMT